LLNNWQGKTDILEGKRPIPLYPPPIPWACPMVYTCQSGQKMENTHPSEEILKKFMNLI
jgi:hypothetical protein